MKISIIIPVYNRAHLIGETLDSLLSQSQIPDEIIVVDDGSTDGTSEVVERFGSPVRLVSLRENRGPGAARNTGLTHAAGSHVIFFDSDDLATPDYLRSRMEVARQTGAQIVYGAWAPVVLKDGVCSHDGFVRQARAVRGDELSAFLRSWILFLPNCLIEKQLVRDAGGYPTDLLTGEDMLLMFRMLKNSAKTAHAPGSLLLVRQHPTAQISGSRKLATRRTREELIMTGRVLDELGNPGKKYAGPARAWRARRAFNLIRAAAADTTIVAEFDPVSVRDRLAGHLWQFGRRLETAVAARTVGHRVPRVFETAPISEDHLAGIRALGYEPRIACLSKTSLI
jgi:hypothetical protein